jgi:hypothetical protein
MWEEMVVGINAAESVRAPLAERPATLSPPPIPYAVLKSGYRRDQGQARDELRRGVDRKQRVARFGQIVVEVGD